MHRPPNIQTERLLLIVLLPEEIEVLLAGEVGRVALLLGFAYPPDDPSQLRNTRQTVSSNR